MSRVLFYKYELIRTIGSGGSGKVYLARDLHLNRLVAVKELLKDASPSELQFLQELEHPGLTQIFDFFEEQGASFLVMEYIEGMSLREYLNKHKRVAERQAVKWMIDLCRILGYLHSRHPAIIYRDLKPENIMIRQDGELKLIDLGAAIRYACGRTNETVCAGTPGYCPPEQWKEVRGEKKWDIYSLGILLHEMLTGASPLKPPYERRPLAEYDRSLAGALDKIINRCLSTDPAKQYQSVEQVEEALLNYRKKRIFPEICHLIRKLFLLFCSLFTCSSFLLPLIHGIPYHQFPFPYLEKPLFFLSITLILYLASERKIKNGSMKQEKNIWLTQKKFRGLFMWFIGMAGTVFISGIFAFSMPVISKGEEQEQLWVEMRDDLGRKMLLKNDAVYITDTAVRFELPADRLPKEEISMQLIAIGEDGSTYVSRIFRVKPE